MTPWFQNQGKTWGAWGTLSWSSRKYFPLSSDLSHQSDFSQNLDLSVFENSNPVILL